MLMIFRHERLYNKLSKKPNGRYFAIRMRLAEWGIEFRHSTIRVSKYQIKPKVLVSQHYHVEEDGTTTMKPIARSFEVKQYVWTRLYHWRKVAKPPVEEENDD